MGAICTLGGFPASGPSLHGNITGLTFTVGGLNVVGSLDFNAPETGRQAPEPAAVLLLAASLSAAALARSRA